MRLQSNVSTVFNPGPPGFDGRSAYQLAVDGGFTGTQAEWLLSLRGVDGLPGLPGLPGPVGAGGNAGIQGIPGPAGTTGDKGDKGDTGDTGPQGLQGIQGLQGATGLTGPAGADGAPGPAGANGLPGADGTNGTNGLPGVGVPVGGTTGQVLAKSSADDYATVWTNPASGGGSPDPLDLVSSNPATPPASTVRVFGRNVGGRMMPAFGGPSGLSSALQPLLARNKVGWFNPPGNATTVHQLGLIVTATGAATTANVATTTIHTAMRRLEYAVTTAAATAVAGVRSGVLQQHIGEAATPYGGFHFIARFGPSRGVASNATRRFWAGMTSITAAPTDVNPSTWAANGIGVGADAADGNWQIMHRTGTGAMTKVNTGIAKAYADNTEMFELVIFTAPSGTPLVTVMLIRLSDGASFTHTITTNLPAATTLLTWQIWSSAGGTSSVMGVAVASIYLETDY